MQFRPEDDSFHERTDNPYWNESGWFLVAIPERRIGGMIWMYHRPNMNLSACAVALWDPTGDTMENCLYFKYDEYLALPKDADMFNFAHPDFGMSCELVKPLESYRLQYDDQEACQFDLAFDAVMEPHDQQIQVPEAARELLQSMGRDNLENVPGGETVNPGLAGWGDRHYDQIGRMYGKIVLEGEELAVDGLTLRDHSWGPRKPRPGLPRAGYHGAIVSPDHHFQLNAISLYPTDQDPILGTTEHVVKGWYTKDGIQANLASGTSRVVERGFDSRPLRVQIEAVDELGRKLEAEGRIESTLLFRIFAVSHMWLGLARWEFDGVVGYGDLEEYCFTSRRSRRYPQFFKQA